MSRDHQRFERFFRLLMPADLGLAARFTEALRTDFLDRGALRATARTGLEDEPRLVLRRTACLPFDFFAADLQVARLRVLAFGSPWVLATAFLATAGGASTPRS